MDQSVGYADAQRTGNSRLLVRGKAHRPAHFDNALGMSQKFAAPSRQCAAAFGFEQQHAQIALQFGDARRNGRLGEMKLIGGRLERPKPCGENKRREIGQIDHGSIL
jgi:hypothetical protein